MSEHFLRRFWGVVGAGAALVVGCNSQSPAPQDISSNAAPIVDGDTTTVTLSQNMPERAVGFITVNGALRCTATPIQRNVILTAGHCFCTIGTTPASAISFHLFDATGADVGPTKSGIAATGFQFTVSPDICTNARDDQSEPDSRRDLGVVFLSQNLNVPELPNVLEVYTGADFLDRIFNFRNPTNFFSAPLEITGWGGQTGVPIASRQKRKASVPQGVNFERDCGFLGLGSCGPAWIEADTDPGSAIEPGDSGGPITFRQNATVPTIFGVANGMYPGFLESDVSTWSPTWNNGNDAPDNGDWVSQFILDADHDGVNDTVDNCAPSRCKLRPQDCANPNQDDSDGDGIGDVCDNCPKVANPSQKNTDGDLFGDMCDLCPTKPNSPLETLDTDRDGVGDVCDNCPRTVNSTLACLSNAGCPGSFCVIDTGTPVGRCADQLDDMDHDGFGNVCDSCPNVGNARDQRNSNDVAELRERAAPLGDACDGAPVFVSRPVGTNSTMDRTAFVASAAIGQDSFNPVEEANRPVHAPFTGAPIGFRHCDCHDFTQNIDLPRDACLDVQCKPARIAFDDPTGSWTKITTGAMAPDTLPQIPAPTFDLRLNPTYTGDLHCTGPAVPPLAGSGRAGTGDCQIGTQQSLFWFQSQDITAGRVHTFPAKVGGLAVNATHGLFWSHGDVATPAVFADSGGRDDSTQGNLRDNYEQIRTPFLAALTDGIVQHPPGPNALVACRVDPQCFSVLRPDWFLRQPREFDPRTTLDPISRIQAITSPALVLRNQASLIAIRPPDRPSIDISPVVSNGVNGLLTDSSKFWLTPVEPGYRGRAFVDGPRGGLPLAAVSMPRNWSQASSTLTPVVGTSSGLFLESELASSGECNPEACGSGRGCFQDQCVDLCGRGEFPCAGSTIPTETPDGCFCIPAEGDNAISVQARATASITRSPYVPSDRTGARALLSATERSVYFVGGRRANAPTGEIWRYSVDEQSWSHLFLLPPEGGPKQVRVGDVQAVAYDAVRGKLVVLDTVVSSRAHSLRGTLAAADIDALTTGDRAAAAQKRPKQERTVARLSIFDSKSGTSRIDLQLPVKGVFSKVGLAARDDGSFVLVGTRWDQKQWVAFQFRLVDGDHVRWDGVLRGSGLVLDDPFFSDSGLLLPVQRGDSVNFVDLTNPHAFSDREHCTEL